MKRLLVFMLVVVTLVGCGRGSTKSDLPVRIGQSKTDVRQILGSPSRTGEDFDSFFDHGLVVDYGPSNEVVSITATHLRSGVTFRRSIFGVSIGDPVAKCIELWGNSEKWEETPFEYSRVTFRHKGYYINLEVWSKDGTDASFGTYRSGTIKRVKLSKDNNS